MAKKRLQYAKGGIVKNGAPNIVRGGQAIPIGRNLYYLNGRSHAKGGIDIGSNPRTGIEAEGGEVVHVKPNELRVLSAQDFIGGGVSPAKQVLAGANPDQVFNNQERFKDANRLNDDGSKYKNGGIMIATINGNVKNGLISTPRPKAKDGGIYIKPSKRGTFTAAAKAHGKSVQSFASQVLNNKDNYSPAMVKKANFARNASKWNHKKCGGRKKAKLGIDELEPLIPSPIVNKTSEEMINDMMDDYRANHYAGDPFSEALDYGMILNDEGNYVRGTEGVTANPDFTYNMIGVSREEQLAARKRIRNQNIAIRRNEILGPGQYQRLVETPDNLTADEIIAATNTAERMGRNFNEDRARKSMNQNKANNSSSSSTRSDSNNTSNSTSSTNTTNSSSTIPRKGSTTTASSASSNDYSITNYEIQSDGSLKANGTRTGQGFRQYNKRSNQKTITDARVSRPWRETIGSDADVLNYIAFADPFEHKRWQDRHSKIQQETGYNPNSGRAVEHEDVAQYSRDFNEKFNQANRKLALYTTPAGRTGDNSTGERRKKFGGRRKAEDGTVENRNDPFTDRFNGAQVSNRYLGSAEDIPYLQEYVNSVRRPLGLPQRALFARPDGKAGYIDALEIPELKGLDVAAPKIDLSPISKTVVPQAQARAAQQDGLNRAPLKKNWRDEIGLGLGLAGSILDPILRGRALRNLRSWTPFTEAPVKLKTNYNINPQLDRIRESTQEAFRDIDANTASSSNALARKQRVRNQAQYAANEQWGLKENKETQLINQDKLNLQGVRNRNTTRLNQWAADDARIANQITMARADNISNAIQNVVGVGLDYLGRKDFKDYINNTKAAIATANPNVDDRQYILNGMGYGNPYNTGIPTLATNTYRRSKFGSRTRLKRK